MNIKALTQLFVKHDRGYVAVAFAILILPILAIVGAGIDYRNIGREYAGLRTAAEAAAVAVARNQFKPSRFSFYDPVENNTTLMNSVFSSNFQNNPSKFTYVTPTLTSVNNTEKSVTVTATAGVKTSLLQMIGFSVFDISVEAKARAVFSNKNVNIHIAIDYSPSMGAPTDGTAPPLNAQGCFFMCHDNGATIRAAGKTPKMDVILSRLGASNGLAQLIANAAATNPPPVTVNFYSHTFTHGIYSSTAFANVGAARAASLAPYELGPDGVYGGTDLKTTFEQLHTYIQNLNATTKRTIIVIISDGMHSRATAPFNPAACSALKGDGDVYTLYVKNPESVYDNPNLTAKVPDGGLTPSRATWDWGILRNGGSNAAGYFSGLNNASSLMKNCASDPALFYQGSTEAELTTAIDQMTENIIAPTIRVVN